MDVKQQPSLPSVPGYEKLAEDVLSAYRSGDSDAMQRINEYTGQRGTREKLRTILQRSLGKPPETDLSLAEAQLFVARVQGFEGWPALLKQIEDEPTDPRFIRHGEGAGQSRAGNEILQRLSDQGQDSELFHETLKDLDEGNFTKMEPLFEIHPSLGRSQCRIVEWFEQGYFENEPKALAEALACACALGKTSVADLMLKNGVDPLAGDNTWLNGFHWAANNGHVDTVKLLIERRVPLEVRNKYGGTVLGQAVWAAMNEPRVDHVAIIEALLDAGADVAEADYPTGDAEIDALLLRHGAQS